MNIQAVPYGQNEPFRQNQTSATGPMKDDLDTEVILPFSFYQSGTASRNSSWENIPSISTQTSSGNAPVIEEKPFDTSSAIMELRRLSGLTWEKLSELFGVARRSLHLWASGKTLSVPNEERLWRLLTMIRDVDRGSASENRSMLLGDRNGAVPFDLLVKEEYDDFTSLVGIGNGRRQIVLTPLAPETWEARKPPTPESLVGALHDTVHKEVGKARPIRAHKVKSKNRE